MKKGKAKPKADLRGRDPQCADELKRLYKEGMEALKLGPQDSLARITALREHASTASSAVPFILATALACDRGLHMLREAAARPGEDAQQPVRMRRESKKASAEGFFELAKECARKGASACMPAHQLPRWACMQLRCKVRTAACTPGALGCATPAETE